MQQITERTRLEIRKLIIDKSVCFFGVGGAVGYDTLAAKILFKLRKEEFPYIKVILVYPFDGFTDLWNPQQKQQFEMMLPQYDKTVCVSNTSNKQAYFIRNRHLVDESSYCICYYAYDQGGTAYTVRYARRKGLEIHNVWL